MTPSRDGGPAFPHSFESTEGHPNWREAQGMSLRDWFAGQALAGLLANANLMDHLNVGENPLSDSAFAASVAKGCYVYADAMLAERAKTGGAA